MKIFKKTISLLLFLSCHTILSQLIIIDPGHGGKDSGAIGYNGIKEKDITLALSLKVSEELKKLLPKVSVVLTRKEDIFIPIKGIDQRSKIAQILMPKIFLSLHVDASKSFYGRGSSLYISNTQRSPVNQKKATILAYIIQENLTRKNGFINKGIHYKNLSILRNTIETCPSVLIELGYISNQEELLYITGKGATLLAKSISESIKEYLEL